MKTIAGLASFALAATLLFSCGNKEGKTNEEAAQDSAALTATSQGEITTTEDALQEPLLMEDVPVETSHSSQKEDASNKELTLSLTMAKDPCYGNVPDYLNIKGGKPFDDGAKPYKLTATSKPEGSVEFETFTMQKDGTCRVSLSTRNLSEDEVKLVISVTDANNTTKKINYTIPHCM